MLQHGKKKFQLQLKKKSYQRMLRSKIIHSKPRSPSSYTSRRGNCDAEVIGIITLKTQGSSFQFISRKTCFEHQAAAFCFCVEIRRLSVPRWVENGTEKSVTLDCEYVYNENDIRLVVKWFFEENLEPVYQWIPELGVRHTSGILHGRLDLNYTVNTVDAYSRYRALKISEPSTELSGKYTCLVTSLAGQDSRAQLMTVFGKLRSAV
ncbi:hypothetical protein AVEN_150846-1 [Araneus ventricosus]|uniref:Ig-like domain-containing protein n=1 Tax=Araneus ventricosus TaxID=182803 RepID=A0A4Y2LYY2_ARAVE|nr:hypothetical protein AVEN_150846-1 [Araneus ventricosus]